MIVKDQGKLHLGYEGSHLYKKDGRYYLFTCHIPAYGTERKPRTASLRIPWKENSGEDAS